MSSILRPVCTGVFCICMISMSYGQFAFSYDGPDTLFVGDDCTAILDWGHPETPDVFPTMPGQVIISWMIFSISGGYMIGDPVPAGEIVTVFYQARDNMGHIALFGFNIRFIDNSPPEFDQETLPEDVTVVCAGEVEIPMLTFSDNCDSDSTMTTLAFGETGDPDMCAGGNISRTWTLTDAAGNTAVFVQEITVLPDTADPVITGIPIDGSSPCGDAMDTYTTWIAAQRAAFMAQDVGCGIATLTDNAPPASVLLGFCGEIEVSFFATDSCGNTSSVIVYFVVTNAIAPTITVPASDASASCDSGNPQNVLQDWLDSQGGAVAIDDCSFVSWSTNPADPSLDDVCNGALIVTFIADDGCGNTASTTAEFFIQDNTPPAITQQAQNVIVNCSTSDFEVELAEWLSNNGNASATDICTDEDSIQVHYSLNGVMLDSLGVINAFQDSILNGTCTDGVIIDGFIWNNVLALITLDFVFTDNCGNASMSSGIFAIRDALGPVWAAVPQDSVLTCAGGDIESFFNAWYTSAGFAEGTDDCGSVFYTGNPTYEDALATLLDGLDTACASGVTVEVAFQLNDFCGNANPVIETATFGIVDSAGPMIIQAPTDLLFACSGNVEDALQSWLDSLGGAQVQDACGDIAWMFSWLENGEIFSGIPGIGPYPGEGIVGCNTTLEVTFSATDICDNTVSAMAAFSFIDTIAPILSLDSVVTIACDSLDFIQFSVSDNCASNPVVTFIDEGMQGDSSFCLSGMITRTWTATDLCGNAVTFVQTIHTADTLAPLFVAPPDTILYCLNTGEIDGGFPTNINDNCDQNPVITYVDSISGVLCDQMILRQWSVTDACGNARTALQQIELIDTIAPALLEGPDDLLLECGVDDPLSVFNTWISSGGGALLSDNCSDVTFFFAISGSYLLDDTTTWPGTPPVLPVLECGDDTLAFLQVDFVYADACGNALNEELNVLVRDTQEPVMEQCLPDTLIVLLSGTCDSTVVFYPPTAFDICGAEIDTFNLIMSQDIISGSPGDSSVVVDTVVFEFSVPAPPVFTFMPVQLQVFLSSIDADASTEFFYVLGEDGEYIGNTLTSGQQCDTITTSLEISSELFNLWSENGIVTLTLVPNTDPGGSASVNDICPGATATVALTAIQGIQDTLTIAYSIDTSDRVSLDSLMPLEVNLHAGAHTLTWFVTDCAGNEVSCQTQITIQDIDPPIITCLDDRTYFLDAEEGCSSAVVLYPPLTKDDCGVDKNTARFSISGDTLINETLFDEADSVIVLLGVGSYVVEFGMNDVSGNSASCTMQVIVEDTLAPDAVCQIAVAYVHPSGVIPLEIDPVLIDGGSSDNCRIDSMIVMPGIFPCDSAGTEQFVELIVFDASGNADTCLAQLTIEVQPIEPTYEIGICATDSLHLFANVPFAPGNPYTFSWTGPNAFVSDQENPSIPGINATYSGLYSVVVTGAGGCTSMGAVDVLVEDSNAPDLSVASTVVCEGDVVMLSASAYNQPVTYRWFRGNPPGGLFLGNSFVPLFSDIPPLPGQYIYYVIVETESCSSDPSETVMVDVVTTPVATVQEPFIEICAGETIALGTDISGPGIAYQWSGPNGFMSTAQFPTIPDADQNDAGTYALVIVLGGCMSAPATTDVIISQRPDTPVISGDAVFCLGGDLLLTVGNVTDADQYIWTNPQMNSISTGNNTLVLNDITDLLEGAWTVIAMYGDCASGQSEPFLVNIEEMLPVVASNNGPFCEGSGDSVTVFVQIIPGVTYEWSGPGGFMSTLPNPTVLGMEGTYTVTATSSSGCTAVATTEVVADDPPGITSLSNTAGTCADSMQNLSFAVTLFPPDNGAYTYQWTGPNGFISDLPNPVIPGLSSELNGTYTLVVSLGSCASDPVSTEVEVQDAPSQPLIDGLPEYCSGETVVVNSTAYPGDSVLYIWNTPVGIIEQWNNNILVIDNATVTNGGLYSVIVQIDGCDSPSSDPLQVTVAQVVNDPVVQAPQSVCSGDSIQLSTQSFAGGIYHWSGPDGFTSQLQRPVIYPSTLAASGSYQVYVQVGECVSDLSLPVTVTVLPLPNVPETEPFEGSICLGDPTPATLCLDENSVTAGALYTWTYQGSSLFGPSDMRCFTLDDFAGFQAGVNQISVSAVLNGCMATASGVIDIPMYAVPEEMAQAGPDAIYCSDDEIMLNASAPSVGIAFWSSPDGTLVFGDVNDPFSDVENLSEGENILIWTLDFESCLQYSVDTVLIYVEPTPQAMRDSVLVPFGETVDINVLINDLVSGAYTFRILPGGPQKGNALYKGQGIITYDPNLGYVGPDRITYEICSEICPDQCTIAEVIIQVGNETDCFIPTIFTPNGDGTNDRLIIPCLETERFPQNRVVIFNEWGDAVFEAKPYANDWDGTRDGKDLPVATYFYIIDFGDGRPVQNGFLILER